MASSVAASRTAFKSTSAFRLSTTTLTPVQLVVVLSHLRTVRSKQWCKGELVALTGDAATGPDEVDVDVDVHAHDPADVPEIWSRGTVIQRVMNLVMPLEDPTPRGKADLVLALSTERDAITTAMDNVGSVHFARFNIVGDDLHLIAVFDGTPQGYIREFALQMGRAFDVIMSRIADWPPPPMAPDEHVSISTCPAEFVEWALRHDIRQLPRDPAAALEADLHRRREGGEVLPPLRTVLAEQLVAWFSESPNAHLSIHRGYPGRSAAQIREALGLGW